ncbi:MAG: UrcA family protein [Brevundimonas sp.]
MKPSSKGFAVAAAFGLISLAPPAMAQAPAANSTEPRSTRVSYADLDVGSEAGMRTLTTRISSAARRVCGQTIHRLDLDEILECRRQARRDAWQQFGRNLELARAARAPMVAASRTDTN